MTERVTNGDFSDDPNDWTVTFNGTSSIFVDSVTGDAVSFNGGGTNTGGSISQTFAVTPGGDGTVSLDFGKIGLGNPDAEVTAAITYVDSNGDTQTLASGSGSDSVGPTFDNRSDDVIMDLNRTLSHNEQPSSSG